VQFAVQQGLVFAVFPTWGFYFTQTHCVNAENAREYAFWLGQRYKGSIPGHPVPAGRECVRFGLQCALSVDANSKS
jgi:hypothetical protein